jgi:hypothetical protein
MRFLTYLIKSLNTLNLLLVAAVVSLAVYLLFPIVNTKATYRPAPVTKQTSTLHEEGTSGDQTPPSSDYMMVAEQNVFHPDRKIPPENKDDKPLAKPEIFLYGTLLTDTTRIAYIEDKKSPQSTPGRGNRQTIVKQGDVVGGFTIKNVETDKIVLVRGEEQMVVFLNDAKKTRTAVTSTQPAGMQPGARPTSSPGPQPMPMPSPVPGASALSPMQGLPQQPAPVQAPATAASQPTRQQPSRPPRTNPTQLGPQPAQ